MTNYSRGYAFEQKCAGVLTQDGYFCVRSGGSHGIADLVALKPGQVVLIQAKIDGKTTLDEWNRLYALANRLGAVPLIASRPKRGVVEFWRPLGPRLPRQAGVYEVWKADEVGHG